MKHLLLALPALPVAAHHSGERIDALMAGREPAFEPTNLRRTPRLRGADGAPMIHVIDRGRRHAAIFRGANFARVNLIMDINELTNARPSERGWLDNILGAFQ
ncbi:MAG: hypothetical protein Q8Q26_00045 [Pseudorhodobacter sp.]|nr:hypothetical protein [Pseudorhodobacter sp.]